MKILIAILALGATLYALVLLLAYVAQDRLIFPAIPLAQTPDEVGVGDMAVVSVRTGDGLDLLGWYKAPAASGRPTLLLFHGNGETVAWNGHIARALIDGGYGVFMAEYRGYGGNPGKPSEAGLYEDGRAALDFLEASGARVVLHGYSLGSGVAVQLATERRVEAVILAAPYTSIADIGARLLPFLPVRSMIRHPFDSLSKIGQVKAPLLIYHGTLDRVISVDHSGHLFEAANNPKTFVVLEGADHVGLWASGGEKAVLSFLETLPSMMSVRTGN
ncbi:alpha/beta hydrolase [Azospirillum himalayense]|uniref:Alpha/beta hydrolase n=1 Tax=Azospirillum himalayense TaxID=654847 RepID=A0ABW0G5A0_9PROT